ncbi:MAG: hypothetical protein H6815_06605 [Phycisphaeraceae bacterium]|nr:hypothetical protein [Phycisphaerales bacterium]MCB9860109.1 hypothetical protein [Phycisphaeraceae bacterium]
MTRKSSDQLKPFEYINLDASSADDVIVSGRSAHGFFRMSRLMTSSIAMFALVFGLLIWAKLRLVSGMPRSVYADPKQVDIPDVKDAQAAPRLPEMVVLKPGMPMPDPSNNLSAAPAHTPAGEKTTSLRPGGGD